jgi:Mg/Co/Ni transporter MgtE
MAEAQSKAHERDKPSTRAQLPSASRTVAPTTNTTNAQAKSLPAYAQGQESAPVMPLLGSAVQAKLAVSQPNDPSEREADEVAARIVSGGSVASSSISGKPPAPTVQRLADEEEKTPEAGPVQRQPEKEEGVVNEADASTPEPIQKKESGPGARAKGAETAERAVRTPGAGEPLDVNVRAKLEPSMGADLSGVRVHTGAQAHEATAGLNARAFTRGNHVWLGADARQDDIGLMAHELTHVFQQDGVVRRAPLDQAEKKATETNEVPVQAADELLASFPTPDVETTEQSFSEEFLSTESTGSSSETTSNTPDVLTALNPKQPGGGGITPETNAEKVTTPSGGGEVSKSNGDGKGLTTSNVLLGGVGQDIVTTGQGLGPVTTATTLGSASFIPYTPRFTFDPSSLNLSPVALDVDNVGLVHDMIDDAAIKSVGRIQEQAQKKIKERRRAALELPGRLLRITNDAQRGFDSDAQSRMRDVEAQSRGSLEQLTTAVAFANSQIDIAVDFAIAGLDAELRDRQLEVQSEINLRINAITKYAQTEADTLRREGGERALRAYRLADQTYERYSTHDKADKVREAVDDVANEAAKRFIEGANEAASGIQMAAQLAAATWSTEAPAQALKLQLGHDEALLQLALARSSAHEQIRLKADELMLELSDAQTSVVNGIDEQRAVFGNQLDTARAGALDKVQAAVVEFEVTVKARTGQAEEEIAEATAALHAGADQLAFETGNLFNAVDARPVINATFGDAERGWNDALAQAVADFDQQANAAASGFAGDAAALQLDAAGSVADEVTRGQREQSGVVNRFDAALQQVADECIIQFANVALSAKAAMDGISFNIISTLGTGYDEAVRNIEQAVFDVRTNQNGVIYELPGKLEDAAREAIKPWYEKAWDFIVGAVIGFFSAVLDFVVWFLKTVVNLVWGFIWGETAFPDAWGGEVVAFIGDLIAGVLVYGDIRDIVKWGIIKPFIMGEGFGWLNLLMMGISLLGVIPLVGDAFKAISKGGVKVLVKRLGKEAAERLVKKIGKEAAEKLAKELGEDGFIRLVKAFGEDGLKEVVQKLGADLVAQLAKELGEKALKEALEKFGGEVLKELAERLGAEVLKGTLERLGSDAIKEMVERVGAAGLKDILDKIGIEAAERLTREMGGHALGDLTMELTADGVKKLVDAFGAEALGKLAKETGAGGIKPLVEAFTEEGLKAAMDVLGPQALGQLAKELGPRTLKTLVDKISSQALKELTEEVGVASIKELVETLGVDAVEAFAKELGGRGFGQLAKELSAAELKTLADQFGARIVAETVREVGLAKYVQIFRQGGAPLVSRIVRQASIQVSYYAGARGANAAVDAFGDVMQRVTAQEATELRRLYHLAQTQGVQAVPGFTSMSPSVQLFLQTPVGGDFFAARFGTALQHMSEDALRAGGHLTPGSVVRNAHISRGGRGIPDIQMPLGGGRWAIFDWTTAQQAGKSSKIGKYSSPVVDFLIEIIHTGP